MADATPAVAIAALRRALQTPGILIDLSHVAEDQANLRSAYPDDVAFAAAVMAIAGAIHTARVQRGRFGMRLEHRLQNYRRAKFQSDRKPKAPSDLRLVFRPVPETNELEIITLRASVRSAIRLFYDGNARQDMMQKPILPGHLEHDAAQCSAATTS